MPGRRSADGRILLAGMLLAAGLLAVAGTALAAARVSELVVSTSADGSGAADAFPLGTRQVYAVFKYEGAAGDRIGVVVEGEGLSELYQSPVKTYQGDGSDAVLITGAAIYQATTARLLQEALELQGTLNKVRTQSVGLQEYLLQCKAYLTDAYSLATLLSSLDDQGYLPATQAGQLAEVSSAVAGMTDLVTDAIYLPPDDVAGKKALAKQMEPLAETLVANAQALEDHAANTTQMPLPETSSEGGYEVQVLVNYWPGISTSFVVSGEGASASPTAASAASPTPTTRSGALVPEPTSTGTSASDVPAPRATATRVRATAGDTAVPAVPSGPGTPAGAGGGTPGRGRTLTATPAVGVEIVTGPAASPAVVMSAATSAAGPAAEQGARPATLAPGQPTWTLPAVSEAGAGTGPAAGPAPATAPLAGGRSGPRPLVLLGGAVVLVGMALWLRQRM